MGLKFTASLQARCLILLKKTRYSINSKLEEAFASPRFNEQRSRVQAQDAVTFHWYRTKFIRRKQQNNTLKFSDEKKNPIAYLYSKKYVYTNLITGPTAEYFWSWRVSPSLSQRSCHKFPIQTNKE